MIEHTLLTEERERLKKTFVRLRYPVTLLENIKTRFITQRREKDDHPTVEERNIKEDVVRAMLPFKDQKSADSVRRQLRIASARPSAGKYSPSTQARRLPRSSQPVKRNQPL